MGDEDDYRARQDNEFLFLQSVYDRELRDLRADDVRKVWSPLELVITLVPQQSASGAQKVYARLDLHVKCDHKYPDVVPEILLENAKGLSTQNVIELHYELLQLAATLRGEVMIFDLALKVQAYLHQHNKPRHESFYDEMLSNQLRLKEQRVMETRRQEELKREAIKEELQRKQEEFREEGRMRKEHAKQVQSPNGSPDVKHGSSPDPFPSMASRDRENSPVAVELRRSRHRSSKSESVGSQESTACDHCGTALLKFTCRGVAKVVQRGRCLGHNRRGCVVYSGLDTATGDLVTVTEWTFKWRRQEAFQADEETRSHMKQFATIEQEMASLCRLQHRNLVHFLGIGCVQEQHGITFQVLQEFVAGGSLAFHLAEGIPIEYELLQFYVSGMLEALSFLHRNSVVHKDLRDTSVFVENRGIVRVADYSLDKRLFELYCSVSDVDGPDDVFPPSMGRGGKKADVYRLGVLCLSWALGYIPKSAVPEVPSVLPAMLRDFLERCLDRSEQTRWSADQLLAHSFLKPSVRRLPNLGKEEEPAVEEEPKADGPDDPVVEFTDIPAEPSGSRLRKEFDILTYLGCGGFGAVYKVRNKLDGGVYAIKRIYLNPSNKQLYRKMTREVRLLSRLNHENVVRYYNSWKEDVVIDSLLTAGSSDTDELDGSVTSDESQVRRRLDRSLNCGWSDSVPRHAPPKNESSVDWSVSVDRGGGGLPVAGDDSSEEEEDEDVFGTSFMPMLEASDGIVFARGDGFQGGDDASCKSDATSKQTDTVDGGGGGSSEAGGRHVVVQFMYIQMEFCDRRTLRHAIDGGLFRDEARVWRLFREIVEGLAHIHQQGMIHRDLKPVNIFFDSSDHVKIGDFGLATTAEGAVAALPHDAPKVIVNLEASLSEQAGGGGGDTMLTSWVGTFLYVSPEVADQTSRCAYSQKVDVYSLGIILFEMFYPPLSTAMERVKVLDSLRKPEIVFPTDFDDSSKPKEVALLRWMLDHDPCQRPTTLELLQSPYLPPPQMEEAELHEVFRHTITNPQSKIYKHMISSLFEQRATTAADIAYDMELHKGSFSGKVALAQKHVTDVMVKVFEKHGAIPVHTPLLMPKSDCCAGDDAAVHLVDHGGGVVALPYDLRVPFCRFVVKNNVTALKRFYISPVYRERKVFGCHPRALHECTFDIVTPLPGCLVADAEVLSVVFEIVSAFPLLHNRSHVLCLNHVSLLRGILLHHGLPEERHWDACDVISGVKGRNLTRAEVCARFVALGMAEQAAQALHQLLDVEGSVGALHGKLKAVVRRRSRAAALIERGVEELGAIVAHLEAFGIGAAAAVVSPSLVYGVRHFSGVIFQVSCALKLRKRRKSGGLDVLAAGGRYDQLIGTVRSKIDVMGNQEVCQSAVGVSIAVEKLSAALLECDEPPGAFDVLVCSVGRRPQLQRMCAAASELWKAGISAHLYYDTADAVEEVYELCHELRATHIVVFKDDDAQCVKLRSLDTDKFAEVTVRTSGLVEVLQKSLLVGRTDPLEVVPQSTGAAAKGESHRTSSETSVVASSSQVIISFATVDKLAASARRRHEAQITSSVCQIVHLFSAKASIEIVAVELGAQILTTIAGVVDLGANEDMLEAAILTVIERHCRFKKHLAKLHDHLHQLVYEKKRSVVILYGMSDGSHRVLM